VQRLHLGQKNVDQPSGITYAIPVQYLKSLLATLGK
jgi:hypothetical protein